MAVLGACFIPLTTVVPYTEDRHHVLDLRDSPCGKTVEEPMEDGAEKPQHRIVSRARWLLGRASV